jgi:hypothetical protein
MSNYTDVRETLPRHATKKYKKRNPSIIDMIVVHCTDANWTIEQLADYDVKPNHISKTGCPACTYHDVIMPDGHLYHCLDYAERSWHAGKYNYRSAAVCLMYRATNAKKGRPNYRPPEKAMKRLTRHLTSLCLGLKVLPKGIKGHRELEGTGWIWKLIPGDSNKKRKSLLKWCPGQYVNMDEVRIAVARRLQFRLKIDGYYKGGLDGIFGPKSIAALNAWKPKRK